MEKKNLNNSEQTGWSEQSKSESKSPGKDGGPTFHHKPLFDSRIYLLISLLTIGLGVVLLILYAKTPDGADVERTIYLICAAALLPSGVLWTVEHYFLQRPIEHSYASILRQYYLEQNSFLSQYRRDSGHLLRECRTNQNLAEIVQSTTRHFCRAISDERASLVRRVLEDSLDDETCREIAIVGSTLDGLFRQGSWFEEFIRRALEKNKSLRLMFTHWDYVTHREKQEDRADGDIAQELKHSLVRAINWKVPPEAIRLVHGAPTVFMVIAGNNMILNPYPFGRESVTSMSVWLSNPQPERPEGPPGTIWHAYYINHYDMVWNPDKYPRKLSTVSEPISSSLPNGWEDTIETFIDGVRLASRNRVSDVRSR